MIVPDSKPPALLLSAGAFLLAGLVIRTLRRRHARHASARGAVVSSTGRRVKQPASSRSKAQTRALVASTQGASARVTASREAVGE